MKTENMTRKVEMSDFKQFPVESGETLSMHPKKFALWLFVVSIVMTFAAMSSAYIVRKGDGNWLEFDLPSILWTSSVVILLSSGTIQWAHYLARKDHLGTLKIAMFITFALGVAFLVLQWMGWQDMQQRQILLNGNPSGSFIYILTGLHAFHLITGIVFLLIMVLAAFRDQIHAKAMIWMDMCTTYWHFLDFLWIYLFAFMLLNR